jgi:putative hydrolase of the HAD superfamily
MLAGKQAVLFDAGFTLLEPTRPVTDVYYAAAGELGISVPEDQFRARLAEAWPRATREFRSAHPDLESSDELERDAWRRFTRLVAEPFPDLFDRHGEWLDSLFLHFDAAPAWRPNPGAVELLTKLQRDGVIVGVVSNWHTSLHQILEGLEMKGLCSFVLTSAEAGRKKPHPQIFEQAIERTGVDPTRIVHIGDSWDDDVEGARAAGLEAVYLCRGTADLVADDAVPVIHCLTELLA